jgi:uncharacterized protein (TIGR00369 family)
MTAVDVRTRTHTWEDPSIAAAAAATMSGLEFLTALASGSLPAPPIMSTLGFEGFTVGPGWARFTFTPAEHHYNPIGSVHGGVAATLLDSALGCAVHSTLPVGVGYTTIDLQVSMVRAMTSTTVGPLRCEGRVIHAGSRVATAEGRITGPDERLYASATATCLVIGSGSGSAGSAGSSGSGSSVR